MAQVVLLGAGGIAPKFHLELHLLVVSRHEKTTFPMISRKDDTINLAATCHRAAV